MPRDNTEATEISVGLGLLGLSPLNATEPQVQGGFGGSVNASQYRRFVAEYRKGERKYRQFFNLGCELKRSYPPFAKTHIERVIWEGPNRQAKKSDVARDLFAEGTSISIKDKSNVVYNSSPYNLFVTLPKGEGRETRSADWYLQVAPSEYRQLYACARSSWWPELPERIEDYYLHIGPDVFWGRKDFGKIIPKNGNNEFNQLYVHFSHVVATESARIFNENLQASLSTGKRSSVIELILGRFFRIDDQEYIFCGLEGRKPFGVVIPGLTAWKREWQFMELEATPGLARDQPVVDFTIGLKNRETRQRITRTFHAEVRWSHGKFCGNPEAKVYKGRMGNPWRWTDTEFYQRILALKTPAQVRNNPKPEKLELVDRGGFAEVWKAIAVKTQEVVALKELSKPVRDVDDIVRFKREVEIQSLLIHDNVVKVLSADISGDDSWYSMPLALNSLEDRIGDFFGNPMACLNVFEQVMRGVEYAHKENVVHRDLKPSNILMFRDNVVKVADFGAGRRLVIGTESSVLTQSGEFLGTLEYAAPEQLDDMRSADERTDIFALGKILCGMLLGKKSVAQADIEGAPVPFHEIIKKCVALKPEDRFQHVDDLREALEAAVGSAD